MSSVRNSASALKAIARISVRNSANVLKEVTAGHMRDASNVLRDLAGVGGMTATASPDSAYGYGSSKGSIRISTISVAISVVGGAAPYTYSWAPSSGWDTIFAGASSTPFRSPAIPDGGDETGSVVCTITDANGQTATAGATLFATNTGF